MYPAEVSQDYTRFMMAFLTRAFFITLIINVLYLIRKQNKTTKVFVLSNKK